MGKGVAVEQEAKAASIGSESLPGRSQAAWPGKLLYTPMYRTYIRPLIMRKAVS